MATNPKEHKLYTVKLKQMYWLHDESKAKLLQLGAVCIDKETEKHNYYDTNMYELARNQMWLSQQNRQWRLIVAHQKQERQTDMAKGSVLQKATEQVSPFAGNGEKHGSGKQDAVSKTIIRDSLTNNHKESDVRKADKHQSDKSSDAHPAFEYHEVVEERKIMTYLAMFLHTALSDGGGGNVTMKEYLQLSGIQHYASYEATVKETYKLLDMYSITIHTDETKSKKTAVISMDADVQHISRSFEDMENLASELQLQHQST